MLVATARPSCASRACRSHLAQHVFCDDLLDQRKELSLLEPDVGLEQLAELPHRRRVPCPGGNPVLKTPHERMDPLVFDQRLHQELVSRALLIDENGEELLLFLAEMLDGLGREDDC